MTATTYGPVLPAFEVSSPTKTIEKLSLVVGILILDFLLWPGYLGISLVLGAMTVFCLKFWTQFHRATHQSKILATGILIAGVLPMVETVNTLTLLIGAGFTFAACFALSNTQQNDWATRLDLLLSSVFVAPFRFPKLCFDFKNSSFQKMGVPSFLGWIVPAVLCGVFVLLFAYASPIWQGWLEAIDLFALLDVLFSPRIFFWIFVGWVSWPFLEGHVSKFRLFNSSKKSVTFVGTDNLSKMTDWQQFAQRCLILFNLVFALQNVLDFGILWGGAARPEGMSYAEYAHRGAYPLVVAALLAGVFVLIALRPGGVGERSHIIRNLVLLWVGQNIILLMSSLLRLDIYITAYALTYWRIAAFIWMLLVAVGLVLIITRFVLKRSVGWLVVANVVVLISTLYATSLVNLPYRITKFNLEHSSMAQSSGSRFDTYYLRRLGPETLPALENFETKLNLASRGQLHRLSKERDLLLKRYRPHSGYSRDDWRAWTYRGHRLKEFVEQVKKQEQSANAAEREAP